MHESSGVLCCWRLPGRRSGRFTAEAQPYPARPITIVVPYAAGGVFEHDGAHHPELRMGELLGQSMIVENVTGGGGIIGVQRAINAEAGRLYTVLLRTVGTHAYNPNHLPENAAMMR